MNGPKLRTVAGAVVALAVAEGLLIRLGLGYGATWRERSMPMSGDDLIQYPTVVTTHATTIDAPASLVWPWLVQMGWHRGGWYTARWVDRLLFPANWPSARRIIPELQHVELGDFIPDGPPETECGLIVERLDRESALVLHSTSHLPKSWRDRGTAELDWTWTFALIPLLDGRRTRFVFRSRWTTSPRWLTPCRVACHRPRRLHHVSRHAPWSPRSLGERRQTANAARLGPPQSVADQRPPH